MYYLFTKWSNLRNKLKDKFIFLFLDYDGTLAPIAEIPNKAVIPKETKEILEELSSKPNCKLAIISGRSLKDIKDKIELKDIIYAGNHGLELEGPKIKFKSPVPIAYRKILDKIKADLNKKLSLIKGAFIEDKGLSLALHYRLVDKKQTREVKTVFHESVIVSLIKNRIKVKSGKMVLEVRPPIEWDKGKVVLWLLARQRFISKSHDVFPIYIGDDLSDEDVFKVLKNMGLTIFVGKPKVSYANYYLRDTQQVAKFLKQISGLQRYGIYAGTQKGKRAI